MRRRDVFVCVLGVSAALFSPVQAQQWIDDIAAEGKRKDADRKAANANAQTRPPIEKPKKDWGTLINLMGKTVSRPSTETAAQRQERLSGIADQLLDLNQEYKSQQKNYQQKQQERYRPPSGANGAGQNLYDVQRAARLNTASNARPDGASSTAPKQAPKPAGFGGGYAGGFLTDAPIATASKSAGGGLGALDDLRADDVEIIMADTVPAAPLQPKKYCQCKADDEPDMLGQICIERDANMRLNYSNQYLSELFPYTAQCRAVITQ